MPLIGRRRRRPARPYDCWADLVAAGRTRTTSSLAHTGRPQAATDATTRLSPGAVPRASVAPSSSRSGFPPSDRGEARTAHSWESPRSGSPSIGSASRSTAAPSSEARR